jgi:peptide/nickel transport system substrate-binding protein
MPNLAEVTFVPVTEGTTRVTTLNTGENDVVKSIPPTSWETVQNMESASIADVLGVSYFYLAFNCNEGPTADPQVREAIDYAVSMDQAVSRFIEPAGERVNSPIPLELAEKWDFPVEEWQSIGHEQDIDQAKSMLDDSDAVPSDWEATIIVPPDDKRENIAVSVSNGLQEAGYGASVQRLDWATFLNTYNTGNASDYNMYALGWSGAPDPDSFMYFLFAHETIGTNNGTHYRNESMNEAIMQARRSTDREERTGLYEQAVSTVLDNRVHLPAYTLKNSFGVRSRVQDWMAHPIAQFKLASGENNVSVQ